MSEFKKGQVLITVDAGKSRSALQGAFAICQHDYEPGHTYVSVKWVRSALARNQNDGEYYPEDFRLASREEVQDATNLAEKQLGAMRELLNSMPKFEVGDFVYQNNGCHMTFPFKVLSISNGLAFCYRPNGANTREDRESGTSTWNIQELIKRPSLDHNIDKSKYDHSHPTMTGGLVCLSQ